MTDPRARPRPPLSPARLLDAAPELAVLAAIGAWAVHAFQVLRHAVDVPFFDDWAFVPPAEGRLAWLFGLEVDHRVVPTKLLVLALHAAGGWDLALHQRIGWGIFTAAMLALGALLARSAAPRAALDGAPLGDRRAAILLAAGFVLLQLSALPRANHVWAVQSAVHFLLLFTLVATLGLFDPAARRSWQIAGATALVLVQLTQASGVVIALALAAGLLAARPAEPARPALGRRVLLVAPALVTAAWAIAAHRGDRVVDYPQADLLGAALWRFLLDLVALGFGVGASAPGLGLLLAIATVAPGVLLGARAGGRPAPADAGLIALAAGLVGTLALIAWARAGLDPSAAKASRFAEIATLLPALAAALWWRASAGAPRLRRGIVLAIWLVAALGLADDWRFGVYRHIANTRIEGRECAAAAWRGVGPADCPQVMLPHQPAAELLEQARERGIHAARVTALPPARETPVESGSAVGVIDSTTGDSPWLVVRGWALDRATGGPPRELVLLSQGRPVRARRVRIARPDVARAEGLDEGAQPALGFELRVRRSAAPALQLDGIAVEAVDAAGRRTRLLAPAWATSPPAARPDAGDAPPLPVLELADGRRPHPLPGALEGRAIVDAGPDGEVSVSGWAVDPVLLEPADRLVVVDRDLRVVADLEPQSPRPAVAERYDATATRRSGFRTNLPADSGTLRVLAISRRGAFAELSLEHRIARAQAARRPLPVGASAPR